LNKSRLAAIFLTAIFSSFLLVSGAMAHAPLGSSDNESLATATVIPNPTKSWAIYAELHEGGEAQYYNFNIEAGQKIHVMLFKSTRSEESKFLPGFILIGPGISEQGNVPDYVETPADAKAFVVEGKRSGKATYEPFSPGSFYSLGEVNINAPSSGTYYVAVYEPSTGGHYGLAVGDRETYTLDEWILIPFSLLSIYQWEGQSLAVIFAPMIITLATGIGLIIWKRKYRGTIMAWLGILAGLLFISTGATTLLQMVFSSIGTVLGPEIALTLVFALVPILLGIATLRLSLRIEEKPGFKKRTYLAVLGIVALVMWAGLIIGPVLAILASVMPTRSKKQSS